MSNPTNATITQAIFASAGVISERRLKHVYSKCCELAGTDPEPFDVQLFQIEQKLLKPIGLTLKKYRSELDGKFEYVLVTDGFKFDDEISPLPERSDAFFEVLEMVFRNSRCQGAAESDVSGLSQKSNQNADTIEYLFANRWLERDGGRIYITHRTLYNHLPFIEEKYAMVKEPKIFKCLGCSEYLMRGNVCSHDSCPGRLHAHCYDKYFVKTRSTPGKCPKCHDGDLTNSFQASESRQHTASQEPSSMQT